MSIETSAKAGHNVKTLFKKIAMALPGGNSELKDTTANQSELDQIPRPRKIWMNIADEDRDRRVDC